MQVTCGTRRSAAGGAPGWAWRVRSHSAHLAIAAYVVPSTGEPVNVDWINIGTFIGAICFMLAALLVKPTKSSLHPDQN